MVLLRVSSTVLNDDKSFAKLSTENGLLSAQMYNLVKLKNFKIELLGDSELKKSCPGSKKIPLFSTQMSLLC